MPNLAEKAGYKLPFTVDADAGANGFAIRDANGKPGAWHLDRDRATDWCNEINETGCVTDAAAV